MAVKKPLEPVLIAMNAALYAGVGYLTFLGIFAPVVGTVRFWPSVVIPAVFAVVYSPRIGALGQASAYLSATCSYMATLCLA
jgi:hypothetical protein